jgi:hypothetical protein
MSKNNGHHAVSGDPMIQHFSHFTEDGAEDQWIAFTLNDDGKVSKSLPVSADATTLFAYGLRQVARYIYDDAK